MTDSYPPSTVNMIRAEYYSTGSSYNSLSKRFGIPKTSIQDMLKESIQGNEQKPSERATIPDSSIIKLVKSNLSLGMTIKQHLESLHETFNKIS